VENMLHALVLPCFRHVALLCPPYAAVPPHLGSLLVESHDAELASGCHLPDGGQPGAIPEAALPGVHPGSLQHFVLPQVRQQAPLHHKVVVPEQQHNITQ
jgi:hypothetical protein